MAATQNDLKAKTEGTAQDPSPSAYRPAERPGWELLQGSSGCWYYRKVR